MNRDNLALHGRFGWASAFFVLASLFAVCSVAEANGLVVSNGDLVDQNTADGVVAVKFDLSWQNAWRDGVNHDAIWVFMKYSDDDGKTWKHASMALSGTNPSGFYKGDGTALEIVVPQDLKGCIVRKSASGSGAVVSTGLKLVWDYSVDGVAEDKVLTGLVVKLFAIEMVSVPQGAFYAGDAGSSVAAFRQGTGDTDPWNISGIGPIAVTNAASDGFYYASSGYLGEDSSGSAFSISPFFPNGFNGFYMMKYEITEGEWVSFFNTLTDAQKAARDITSGTGKGTDGVYQRNTVAWTAGKATSARENRACNYLSWADGAAFSDWAGLRPMTELEYEKAARGSVTAPVADEFVWGSTSATAASSISGLETAGSETVSGGNAAYNHTALSGGDGGQGPLRAGIFATQSSTRQVAGAGYYGAMELSGNLAERVVSVGNSLGRAFVGSQGDGVLSAAGNANNSDWPGYAGGEILGADGSGIRGGSWSDASARLRTSDRQEATQPVAVRHSKLGFRAVRTAP
jgi:formylglycine-generating enzyme required for sulfatase activity